MIPKSLQPTITSLEAGKKYSAFGDDVFVLLSGEQTGGTFTSALIVTPPGGGPPPHYHTLEDEWFIVQEGRAGFFADGVMSEGGPGTVVFLPKGSVHYFRNIGDTPLKMILHTAPAGFETFFARIAEAFNQPAGPDMERIVEISKEHGIFYPDEGTGS